MPEVDEYLQLRSTFETFMVANYPTVPRAQNGKPFNGAPFDPKTKAVVGGSKVTWVQLNLVHGIAFRASAGLNGNDQALWRHPGQIFIKVFDPQNSGFDGVAMCTAIEDIWRDLHIQISATEFIQFRGPNGGPTVVPVGPQDNGWTQSNIMAGYFRERYA